MSRIWVTRTLPGAVATGEKLSGLGYDPVIAPLLEISPPDNPPAALPHRAILAVTSKNGVAALAKQTDDRHWPMVTVGDATAQLARQAGFQNVRSAGGTSDDVTKAVKSLFSPAQGPVIHISGKYVRGDITGHLRAACFEAERRIYYQTHPVAMMPNIDVKALKYVMIHSPLAAKTLSRFSPDMEHVTVISISAAADAALGGLGFQACLIASKTTEKAMLSLLD